MAELLINEPSDKGFQDGYLNGVTLCYTKIQKPDFKYNSKTEKQYSVDAVVDEDLADLWEENFKKNTPKKIKTVDFKDKYKIDPPYPDAKNQYIIAIKANAEDYEGVPIEYDEFKRPKVYLPDSDGDLLDITKEKLIGNGSTGDIRFYITRNDYGTFPHLVALCVEDYVTPPPSTGGEGSNTAFGRKIKVNESADGMPPASDKGFEKAPKKPVAAKKAPPIGIGEDIPF